MKLLCITDGINNFGTDCEPVKAGQVYTLKAESGVSSYYQYQGTWYELEEMPGYTHWSGLFVELEQEEKICTNSIRDCDDLIGHPIHRLKIHLKLNESLN